MVPDGGREAQSRPHVSASFAQSPGRPWQFRAVARPGLGSFAQSPGPALAVSRSRRDRPPGRPSTCRRCSGLGLPRGPVGGLAPHSRLAGQARQPPEHIRRLGGVAVLDACGDPLAGDVEPHRRESEPALHRTLHPADALHLLQRYPGRLPGDPAAGGDDITLVGPASSSPIIWAASARDPTGTSARSRRDSDLFSCRCRAPATSTSTRHQPSARHASGSTSRTAWTRPGRMVSAVVCTRPECSRSPSAAAATTVP